MLPVTTTATPLGYQPGLDGLRGVFVVAVLLFHGGFAWASGGFMGVSAFFTLSGFLICSLLVDERADTGRIDLGRFWVRRARRLLPAAWLALGGVLLYGATLASPSVQRDLQGDVLAALAYVANWRFIASGSSYEALFAEPSPVTHLWSLAIEEQYYLVFPLLLVGVMAVGRGRRVVLGATLAVLAVASTVWMAVLFDPGVDTARVYYGTDTRVAEMLIGAVAALFWRRWRLDVPARPSRRASQTTLQVAGMAALVAIVASWSQLGVSSAVLYRGGFALHALLVVVVLFAAVQPGPVRALTAFEPLRRLGLISYGVYLFHWPIFLWLNPVRTGLDGWALFSLRVGVTLAVSITSYLLVERPIRRGVVLRGKVGLAVAPVAAVVLVAGALLAPSPAPSILQAGQFGDEIDPFAGLDHDIEARIDEAAESEGSIPTISVFGDSTAIGAFYGLLDVDSTTGRLVVVPGHMRLGCGLVRAASLRSHGELYPLSDECASWPQNWSAALESSQPNIAVVLFGPWDASDHLLPGETEWIAVGHPRYDEFARAEIREALELLTGEVDLVVWLTSPPIDQGRNAVPRGPIDPASDPARIIRWNELVAEAVAEYPEDVATMVDLRGWFEALPDGPFDPVLRPDGVHIADDEAPVVGRWLAEEILALWERHPAR
jgi:peptidoglycan/LPS O-acetylase OafA/YrhL